MKSKFGVHFSRGIEIGPCDGKQQCDFAKNVPISWRHKTHCKSFEKRELDEEELKELYIDIAQYLDDKEVRL